MAMSVVRRHVALGAVLTALLGAGIAAAAVSAPGGTAASSARGPAVTTAPASPAPSPRRSFSAAEQRRQMADWLQAGGAATIAGVSAAMARAGDRVRSDPAGALGSLQTVVRRALAYSPMPIASLDARWRAGLRRVDDGCSLALSGVRTSDPTTVDLGTSRIIEAGQDIDALGDVLDTYPT